jgi:septal ring factor EnvC (AmiA/AmiB activator)
MTPANKIQLGGMLKKTVLLLSTSYMGLVFAAGDLPSDYIGSQSFDLKDDPRLSRLRRQARQSKKAVEQAQKKVQDFKSRVDSLQSQVTKLKDDNVKHQSQIDKADANKARFQQIIQDMDAEIAQLNTQIQTEQQNVTKFNNQKAKLETQRKNKQAALKQKRQDCRANPNPNCQNEMKAMRQEIQQLAQKIKNKTAKAAQAQKAVKQKQSQVATKQKTKKDTQAKLANLPNSIKKWRQAIKANRQSIQQKNGQIAQLKPQLRTARQAAQTAKADHDQNVTRRQDYRQRLIDRIMQANKNGAQDGRADGRADGREYANYLGDKEGDQDGNYDGDVEGTQDGRDRDYNEGRRVGYQNGVDSALQDADVDGKKDGRYQANVDAATADGKAAGQAAAQASDASAVGTNQGKAAGLQRAISTGKINGSAQGEQKAINNFESKQLQNVEVQGPFAGSFAKDVPDFPFNFRGDRFDPSNNARRDVVKKAFADGYRFRYRNASERAFNRNIDAVYNGAYDSAFDRAYRMSYNDFYQADYQRGQNLGEDQGYKATYPSAYQDKYDAQYGQTILNPNKNKPVYQQTFKDVKADTYADVYESTRVQYYNKFEPIEFNANIDAQTKKFRQERRKQVADIYRSAPVLKFESSSIKDNGTNGVGSNDGVFMPGENIGVDVVITNFGKQPANDVIINTGNGQAKLPSIPAQSVVTVKGASQGIVHAAENQTQYVSLTLSSNLTKEAKIQGRHFQNAANGTIASGAAHQVTAAYPLNVTNMALDRTLLMDAPAKLSISVANKSNRAYQGNIQVVLSDDSRTNVIVNKFGDILQLNQSLTLNDALVVVKDEVDAYSTITVNAKLVKNGVLLGKLDLPFTMTSKAPYNAKPSEVVVVANSDSTPSKLKDVLAQTGGLTDTAVLDMSLGNLNKGVIQKGLKKKTLLVIDNGSGAVFRQLDQLMSNSQGLSVLAFETPNFEQALAGTQTFKNAESFDIKLRRYNAQKVIVSNPLIAKNHAQSFVATEVDLNNFEAMAQIFKASQLSNDELIADVQASTDATNFYAPTTSLFHKLQMFNLRMLTDVLNVNKAYKVFNEDEKYKKMIKNDSSLFHNKILSKVGSVNGSNVGLALLTYDASIMLKKATKYYRPIEDKIEGSINRRLWGAFFSSGAVSKYSKIPRAVKKHDKKLSRKMVKYENVYSAVDLTGVDLPDPNRNRGGRR